MASLTELDDRHCITLADVLTSFNAPLSEEHVWALCYQCAKCFRQVYSNEENRTRCKLLKDASQIIIHKDGYIHLDTISHLSADETAFSAKHRQPPPSHARLLVGLGLVLFQALDFGLDEDEERSVSPPLEKLLQMMVNAVTDESANDGSRTPTCDADADADEGIERDSEDSPPNGAVAGADAGGEDVNNNDNQATSAISFHKVTQICSSHVGGSEPEGADSHFQAVCRALVAEAVELSSFLQQVSRKGGALQLSRNTDPVSPTDALEELNFSDWACLWMQVIRELRRGVKLKKTEFCRAPIEFELTPYEILMSDIRSRRYKLNKVLDLPALIPAPVKKDAHAVILQFIRSRPPLKKASERKLAPYSQSPTPREKLMESIKGRNVTLKSCVRESRRKKIPYDNVKNIQHRPYDNEKESILQSKKKLIKVDFSALQSPCYAVRVELANCENLNLGTSGQLFMQNLIGSKIEIIATNVEGNKVNLVVAQSLLDVNQKLESFNEVEGTVENE